MRRALYALLIALMLPAAAVAQTTPTPPAPAPRVQRGDVAVGYAYVRNFALGVAVTDGWCIGQHADVILEGTWGRGSMIPGIDETIFSFMGGVRGKFSSRYGAKSAGLIEVLAGYAHVGASDGLNSIGANGFGMKVGGGGDIGINQTVSIRPMFYILISHLGEWTTDPAFTLSVGFKLFK